MAEVRTSNPTVIITSNNRHDDNSEIPVSPIRERTQKAIAQHRALRKPDLRRTYAGTSVSAVVQRPPTLVTQNYAPRNYSNISSIPTNTNNVSGSSSLPFDAAAAIYEDIELSEQQREDLKTSGSMDEHLLQIESLILTPSMKSNASSASERSLHMTCVDDEYIDSSYRAEQPNSRLGIEANVDYDNDPMNEVELLRRQKYVYESYRTLQPPSIQQQYATISSPHEPIVFRDDESAGTGMSQQS
jgi:hypothetical protein